VDCPGQNEAGFYRPRKPWETPLYRLLQDYFDDFERVYPERFQHKYGFWCPVIRKAIDDYLNRAEGETGSELVEGQRSAAKWQLRRPA